MYGTNITVVGNVVDEVVNKPTSSGLSRASFRIASTQRRRDRESGQWVDGHKFFINVTAWREMAENVAASVRKGDPVIVSGRIFSRQYVRDESNHVAYELDPEAIGHDLARGTGSFTKRRRGMSGSVELDADGMPIRVSDQGYEMVDESEVDDGEDFPIGPVPELTGVG